MRKWKCATRLEECISIEMYAQFLDYYINGLQCECGLVISKGLENSCGYMGKGWEGRGQGMECPTPHKPLPLSKDKGIPSLLLVGKSCDVCGHLPHHKQQILSFSMMRIYKSGHTHTEEDYDTLCMK